MTKNELMQIYYLDKEISSWHEDSKKLRNTGEWRMISKKLKELEKKRGEIINYIMSIEDPQTRLIFKLRCFNQLSWNEVADKIGGMNSEYTVKKRFYRFLEKTGA